MTLPADGNAPLNNPSHYGEHTYLRNALLRPNAIVTRTTTQNLGTGAWGAATWVTEIRDTANLWDAGQPTRFTCPPGMGGLWLCQVTGQFQSNTTGIRGLQFYVNGSTAQSYAVNLAAAIAGTQTMSTAGLVPLVPGDYVEAFHYQNSGGTLTIGGVNAMFSIVQVALD